MAQDTANGDGPLDGIRDWLAQTARVLSGSPMTVPGYAPTRHSRLVSFDGLEGYEELDRYWLNVPFAFVSVNYDPEESEHYYHVVEPALSDLERRLLDRLFDEVRDPLLYREDVAEDPEAALREELHERLEEYGVSVAEESSMPVAESVVTTGSVSPEPPPDPPSGGLAPASSTASAHWSTHCLRPVLGTLSVCVETL